MTQQYQEESINGQPSALSLRANPSVLPAAGLVDTEAIFWPSLAGDAVIVGDGLAVAGDANVGTIIEVGQPGLYQVSLTLVDLTPGPNQFNILRGATLAITVGNGYPAADFAAGIPLGAEMIGQTPIGVPPPFNTTDISMMRITGADLEDPTGGVNSNRQIRFSALAAVIPSLLNLGTLIDIQRVSM